MKLGTFTGGLLLAPVAALMLAAMPLTAQADPPFGRGGLSFGHGGPPGLSHRGGFPPGAQKFGHGGFCPPGLRDKGCVPPGLHRFGRGDVIPHHLRFTRLDYRDYGMPRPGPGYFYGAIDGDAYLIAEGTRRVIEAITLFDAVGR